MIIRRAGGFLLIILIFALIPFRSSMAQEIGLDEIPLPPQGLPGAVINVIPVEEGGAPPSFCRQSSSGNLVVMLHNAGRLASKGKKVEVVFFLIGNPNMVTVSKDTGPIFPQVVTTLEFEAPKKWCGILAIFEIRVLGQQPITDSCVVLPCPS